MPNIHTVENVKSVGDFFNGNSTTQEGKLLIVFLMDFKNLDFSLHTISPPQIISINIQAAATYCHPKAQNYILCDLYGIEAQHILEINLHVGVSLNGSLNRVSQ